MRLFFPKEKDKNPMHPSPEKKQIKLDFSEKAYMLKASKQANYNFHGK